MAKKKIKMLKPGTFKDMHGTVVNLSEADLQATAAAYDPAVYACPMVVGHPKADHPAYGKIAAADFSEGTLQGDPSYVDAAFAEIVNKGYYDKVSLSLFTPTSPANPKPGVWYLRHLGFLGAMAPAVPGLGTVSLAAEEEGVVNLSVDLGSWNDRTIARMFRSIKNFLVDKFGKEEADKVLDEWDLETVTEEALRPETPAIEAEPSFAAPTGGDMDAAELKRREAAVKEGEEKLARDLAALKTQNNTKLHSGHVAFADQLVQDGKLVPANKAALVAVLDFAAGITEGDTVEFGEGDGKKTESPAKVLQDIFTGMPKIIEFAELGGGEQPGKDQGGIPANLSKHV